ncbi:MAG TPA: hypothetical protein VIO43_01295 [Lutibacter sp.]
MKTRNLITYYALFISLLFVNCKNKVEKTNTEMETDHIETVKKVSSPIDNKLTDKIDYNRIYKELEVKFVPEVFTEEEFNNFKKKSNYIKVIEAYDAKNPSELFGGKKYADNIRHYELPTEINTQKYANNSILFGDLNNDGKRDCIISVFRSDSYNEVTFFYVFINNGNTFKLKDVANEDDICGCKTEGWPHQFRYQKIEDGFLKGISMCHYKDAHCCPSLYFITKVAFTAYSGESVHPIPD